jgi:hypothetical protein
MKVEKYQQAYLSCNSEVKVETILTVNDSGKYPINAHGEVVFYREEAFSWAAILQEEFKYPDTADSHMVLKPENGDWGVFDAALNRVYSGDNAEDCIAWGFESDTVREFFV